MGSNRTELSAAMSAQWAQMAHVFYIESLMGQSDLNVGEIAFHGGTSLKLSWRSARFSEDLDFLLSKSVQNFDRITKNIEKSIGEMARRVDPEFIIEVKDRTKDADRMSVYVISVSHPAYVGKAKVKAEYWKTEPEYLENYPTQLRTPFIEQQSPYDFIAMAANPVPAATLETAYADKLVAFATRPFIKWRDIYDLWWIGTQTSSQLDLDSICKQFLHNITAYTPLQELSPSAAIGLFLSKDRDAVISQSDPDLKNWLPTNLWNRLHPKGVAEMVDYVFYAINAVKENIDGESMRDIDLKHLPRNRDA